MYVKKRSDHVSGVSWLLTLKSSFYFLGLGFLTFLGVSEAPRGAWGSVHSDSHQSGCVFSSLAAILSETFHHWKCGKTNLYVISKVFFGFFFPLLQHPMSLWEPSSYWFSLKELLVSSHCFSNLPEIKFIFIGCLFLIEIPEFPFELLNQNCKGGKLIFLLLN